MVTKISIKRHCNVDFFIFSNFYYFGKFRFRDAVKVIMIFLTNYNTNLNLFKDSKLYYQADDNDFLLK